MEGSGSGHDSVSANDRGLAYGDGVFETIRIHGHSPVLLDKHLTRLIKGAERLKIPLETEQFNTDLKRYVTGLPEHGVLKIIVTRGVGGRGYRPSAAAKSTWLFSLHQLPDYGSSSPEQGISAFVCHQRLADQPALAGIKHLNRLEQVLASLEWPGDEFMEGLMLDQEGNVIEGTRSNIFWAEQGRLLTPMLNHCGVEGVLRNTLLEQWPDTRQVDDSPLSRLLAADEVFVCNSVFGIWPLHTVMQDDRMVPLPGAERQGDYTARAQTLFAELLVDHDP